MSYDLKLSKKCDNKVIWDDHIVENDFKTVILGVPITNSNVVVRINDFKRLKEQQTETLLKEDVSGQVTGQNKIFFVENGPIFSGLKVNQLATRPEEVVVRIKVEDENVKGQFTGIENYFFTQGKPLLRSNNYDFNSFVKKDDVSIKINGQLISSDRIQDIDAKTGRIQLKEVLNISDTISITYFYRAKIKELDAQQSKIIIKELPKLGQEVKVAYFSRQNDGWFLKKSENSKLKNSENIEFYKNRNTNRFFIEKENVSNQFTGVEKSFFTMHSPILPIFQLFSTTYANTLNNAVVVYFNNEIVPIASIIPEIGKITLFQIPKKDDKIEISYYYQTELEADRISVDYTINESYCDKCSKNSDLLEYSIDKLGHYEKVYDENKLIQDLKKIIRTVLGSDRAATWYGTEFDKLIGNKIFTDIIKTKIANEISTALSKLKTAQIKQEEYQKMSDHEFLDLILKINVNQSVSDPSFYVVDVEVSTQSGRLVTIKETVQTRG